MTGIPRWGGAGNVHFLSLCDREFGTVSLITIQLTSIKPELLIAVIAQ